jgi:DNA-binding NarL/FixJ family response regulator
MDSVPGFAVSLIRVVLADDHALVRAGLRSLLERIEGVEVAGEASDGHEALRLIERVRPHVALVDITMSGLNGVELTARISPGGTRVIIVSVHSTAEYVRRALRAGAAGYLLKDASAAELEAAVRSVARGDTYLSPSVAGQVVEDSVHPSEETSELERLTPRQREILQMVAEGLTTKQIATRLEIGVRTVEAHRADLMTRLDIHDLPGLVRYAIRVGLVDPER